jgi:DNA-binding LacI/PurR family transcriptional regulator
VATEKQPTIRDVAARAGVSHQTVSRVLNDSPALRAETRDRVRAVMREMGYRPSAAARALVTNRSGLIGILAAESHSFYGPATAMSAIEQAARDAGYRVPVVNVASPDGASLTAGLEHLLHEAVEAIVLIAPQGQALAAIETLSISVPFVTLGEGGRGADPRLSVDQSAGARLATSHLLELGHTRIAHIAGPSDWLEADARVAGFEAELDAAGLAPEAIEIGDWSAESGYRAGLRIIDETRATAVFAGNDQMALGLMHACADRAVRVPQDLSVVGFDDVPEAAHYLPPLTTIRQDFAEVGRRTVDVVLAELSGADVDASEPVPPSLIVRASTAPA